MEVTYVSIDRWKAINKKWCVCVCVYIWTAAHQAPLSMGLSRQEYWSWLPCPSPGDLPYPGTEPGSSESQADSLPSELLGKSIYINTHTIEYCSVTKKKEILSLTATLLDLKGIILGEISQREKNTVCLPLYMELKKQNKLTNKTNSL